MSVLIPFFIVLIFKPNLKKMKYFFMLFTSALLIFISGCAQSQDCVDNINKLPMYGKLNNIKKCKEQIEADNEFIADMDKQYKKRKDGAEYMVTRGWEYLRAQKLDMSMMRFNQAWMLDSLNYQTYWGFGNLLGMQKRFKESLPYFEMALKLNRNNVKLWQDASTSYGNIFFETKDIKYLNLAIDATKGAIKLDPKNPQLYSLLTAEYSYFMQKDSAQKYLKITDQLDPKAINPEVRNLLKSNK
jgi:tetratricopeptide (TPR) repeat protein